MSVELWYPLALVTVPEPNGRKFGTGYAIGRSILLTAHHVVRDLAEGEHVRVRFNGKPGLRGWEDGPSEEYRARVLWPTSEDSDHPDAAVLELVDPPPELPFLPIAFKPPDSRMDYDSMGYADVGRSGDEREPKGLGGKTYSARSNTSTFEITELAGPEDVQDWSGASGAPVIIGRRVFGVLSTVLPKLPNRITAISTASLFACDSFQAAVGAARSDPRLDRIKKDLVKLLDASNGAVHGLHQECPKGCEFEDETVGTLVCKLIQTQVEELIEWIDSAHMAVCDAREDHVQSDSQALFDILQRLVPALFDVELARFVRDVEAQGPAVIRLPVATALVAEIALAQADERRMNVEFPQGDPKPKFDLASTAELEAGIDEDGSVKAEDFRKALASKFQLKLPEAKQAKSDRLAEFDNEVDGMLLARRKRPYYEFFCVMLRTRGDLAKYKPTLDVLEERYPSLRVVCLDGADVRGEMMYVHRLREMHRRQNRLVRGASAKGASAQDTNAQEA